MRIALLWMLAMAGMSAPAGAVMKCTGQGKTWYQDGPCETGSTGAEMHLDPAPVVPAAAPPAPAVAPSPIPPAAQVPPAAPQAPDHPGPSAQEREAQACLAWYQKEEPRMLGSQYLSATKEKQVVTVEVSVPYRVVSVPYPGGGIPEPGLATVETGLRRVSVACEMPQGRIDEGWTRIHAKRVNW